MTMTRFFVLLVLFKVSNTGKVEDILARVIKQVSEGTSDCISINNNLLTDELMSNLSRQEIVQPTWHFNCKECICFLDPGTFLEFVPQSQFSGLIDLRTLAPVAFAVKAINHNMFVVTSESLSMIEYWLPRSVVPKGISSQLVQHCSFHKDPNCPLAEMILNSEMQFHGETLTAAFDNWNPFVFGDTQEGKLSGGIFPDVFDVLAAMLNFTVK